MMAGSRRSRAGRLLRGSTCIRNPLSMCDPTFEVLLCSNHKSRRSLDPELKQRTMVCKSVFLLPAIGCPDIDGILNAEIERTETTAVVKCMQSHETWHLVCRDNAWIGEIKNCSAPAIDSECHFLSTERVLVDPGKSWCGLQQQTKQKKNSTIDS